MIILELVGKGFNHATNKQKQPQLLQSKSEH